MLRKKITVLIDKALGDQAVQLEVPEREEFGDYTTNLVMQKFAEFTNKNIKNPRQLADRIVNKLETDKKLMEVVDRIEAAGPGFINFWLKDSVLVNQLNRVNQEKDKYGSSKLGKGKTVVIDYSSPNIAKHFGIGHLRSTVIGQALYNLYSFLGYQTIGDNHLGDWGTQFGAILAQIKSENLKVKNLNVDKLEQLYIDFNKKAKDDPKLWDEARAWFKKLEKGDKRARQIWEKVKKISLAEFERIYKLLEVQIDYAYGESFYEDKMSQVIKELKDKGLIKKSEGAQIVELKNIVPAMLVKSDGTTTYLTRDLATLKFRIDEWKPNLIIYEVGSEQVLHFKQVFEVAKILSWTKGRQLVHVAHGLIRFKEGKMSTRQGQTIKLEKVLDEAIIRAEKLTENSKTGKELTKLEKEKIAKAVGIGAVKYFDLMHHPKTDIIFDWEKMFLLEGNSAPYLQYTVARTESVLRRAKTLNSKHQTLNKSKSSKSKTQNSFVNLKFEIGDYLGFRNLDLELNNEELSILRSIIHFPEVVEDAAKNYSPNLLCTYLFDLASKFNLFYNTHRILPSEKKNEKGKKEKGEFRLALTIGVGQILKNGLNLLGIESPEKM